MAACPEETVVMLRHDAHPVRHKIEAAKPLPKKENRLRCQCGSYHFFVTKVDFVCVMCSKSYRD